MNQSLTPLEFFLDAIDRYQRVFGGELPESLVMSPESCMALLDDSAGEEKEFGIGPGQVWFKMRGVKICAFAVPEPYFVSLDRREIWAL
jgi:hypothetical protein